MNQTQPTPPKLLHIFKPGVHTTMAGEAIAFSAADLAATARAYNPALSKAPLVIGHPATDDPAQGWAARLNTTERGLFAEPARVDAAFAQAVNAGRYASVSVKFYRPGDAQNPVPGVWYLRHIGFLGAAQPAVKGLQDPAFAQTDTAVDDGCVCFAQGVAFSGWDDLAVAGLFRNLREFLIGKFGQAEADQVLPGQRIDDLQAQAQADIAQDMQPTSAPNAPAIAPQFAHSEKDDVVTPEEKAALVAANTRMAAELAAAHKKLADDAADQTHAAHVAFCEGIAPNRLLPAWRAVALATLDHLASASAPVQFTAGDTQAPLLEAFKGFLAALPEAVQFGQVALNAQAAEPAPNTNPLLADAAARAAR